MKKTAAQMAADVLKEEKEEEEGKSVTMEEVKGFLRRNTAPEDYELHRWAEGKGVSPHSAEELLYQLAAQQVTGKAPEDTEEGGPEEKEGAEQIPGGKAEGKPDSVYPAKQIAMGIKVEKEHSPDPAKAKEIAKDHLEEFPGYYTGLKNMEDKMKKSATEIASMVIVKVAADVAQEMTPEIDNAIRKMERDVTRGKGTLLGMGAGGLSGALAALLAKQRSAAPILGMAGAALGGGAGALAGHFKGKARAKALPDEYIQDQLRQLQETNMIQELMDRYK